MERSVRLIAARCKPECARTEILLQDRTSPCEKSFPRTPTQNRNIAARSNLPVRKRLPPKPPLNAGWSPLPTYAAHGVLKMTIDEDHCLANIEPGRGPYCFGVARKLFSHRVAHSHTSDVLSPNIASGRGALLLRGCAQAFFRTGLPTRTHLMFCLVTDFAPYSCLTRSALLTHVLSGNCLCSLLLPHTRFSPHLLRAHTCAMAGATQAAGSPLCFVFGGCRLSLHGDGIIFAASDASDVASDIIFYASDVSANKRN